MSTPSTKLEQLRALVREKVAKEKEFINSVIMPKFIEQIEKDLQQAATNGKQSLKKSLEECIDPHEFHEESQIFLGEKIKEYLQQYEENGRQFWHIEIGLNNSILTFNW